MSTQTSKLELVKQANNENWSNDIHNANNQKIDDFAVDVDPRRTPEISAVGSDSYLLGLNYGAYQVNLSSSADTAYIPEQWGVLHVCRSGVTYRAFIFIGTSGKVYSRHGGSSSWHCAWQQMAVTGALSTENVLSTIAATFTAIATSDARIVYTKQGIFHSLQFKFKCSSSITTGSVTLPTSVTGSLTEVYCALASLDGNGGMAQLSGRTLYIRCGASSTNFMFGQLNWVA